MPINRAKIQLLIYQTGKTKIMISWHHIASIDIKRIKFLPDLMTYGSELIQSKLARQTYSEMNRGVEISLKQTPDSK